MENLISRYRNVTVLVAVLFAQVLGLAVQVKRSSENESSRLIRVWVVNAITPFEKGIVGLQGGVGNLWRNYFYLRGVRKENYELKQQIEHLRLEQVRLNEDAEQARRLQALLGFKEQFISQTLPAQVIGSSGSEQSRSIYIDKGGHDGIKQDMPVITADGIVGKVLRVFGTTSQVLLIDDQTSGVGAILEKSRLQGVLRGTPAGEIVLEKVTADETVQPGEKVLTSGGDQVFPKGLPVGMVTKVSTASDLFLNVRVKPTANLSKLEEVLVITKKEERMPSVATTGGARAVDILAQRLPSVPDKPAEVPKKQSSAAVAATPQLGTDKVKAQPTGISPKPMADNSQAGSVHDAKIIPGAPEAATSTKPASGDLKIKSPGIKSAGSTIIKPATQQKTVPPPMKVSEKIAKPAVSTPKPPAKQPAPNQSAPNQPEASQPTNPPVTKPAAPPQEEPVPQENKPQ
ncbi:MAG: rod shape-determining protein MreC [Acidobacteria bacterium]|nr:MAG: rod shape-determining protein MreC [Acidobacteriota bacterium]